MRKSLSEVIESSPALQARLVADHYRAHIFAARAYNWECTHCSSFSKPPR